MRNEARVDIYFIEEGGSEQLMPASSRSNHQLSVERDLETGVLTSDAAQQQPHRLGLRIDGWQTEWVQVSCGN